MENFEEAVKDYETALKLDKSMETKNALKDAKLQLKKSKRKDYYKILGITKSATEDEIKKAYRKRGKRCKNDEIENESLNGETFPQLSSTTPIVMRQRPKTRRRRRKRSSRKWGRRTPCCQIPSRRAATTTAKISRRWTCLV